MFLKGPLPIQQAENNWPLLTMSKGFFENVMAAKSKHSEEIASIMSTVTTDDVVGDAWGDDADLKVDDEDDNLQNLGGVSTDGEISFLKK